MGNSPTRKRRTEKAEVGQLAVDLLAYAAMGAEDALQQLILNAPGVKLGRVMLCWYQMCEAVLDPEKTSATARVTAQAFQKAMDEIVERGDMDDAAKQQALAYSIARGLLIDLATAETERFVELWESTMRYDVEVIVEIVALMLGFTRGVLDSLVTQ